MYKYSMNSLGGVYVKCSENCLVTLHNKDNSLGGNSGPFMMRVPAYSQWGPNAVFNIIQQPNLQ